MKRRHAVLALALAGAIAAACSKSSTGPSDPYVGTWQFTIQMVAPTMSFAPTPWNVTISQNGASYKATYADLQWKYTSPLSVIDTYSDSASSSNFGIMAGHLQLTTQDPNAPACELNFTGTFVGNAASGTVNAAGTMCTPGSWPWTATKQ